MKQDMTQIITTATNDALVAAHINSITRTTGSAFKGVSTAMLIEEAKKQMREGVCHFIYQKKDGSIREAMGTLDKSVLRATLKGTGNSPEEWGVLLLPRCYQGWRTQLQVGKPYRSSLVSSTGRVMSPPIILLLWKWHHTYFRFSVLSSSSSFLGDSTIL